MAEKDFRRMIVTLDHIIKDNNQIIIKQEKTIKNNQNEKKQLSVQNTKNIEMLKQMKTENGFQEKKIKELIKNQQREQDVSKKTLEKSLNLENEFQKLKMQNENQKKAFLKCKEDMKKAQEKENILTNEINKMKMEKRIATEKEIRMESNMAKLNEENEKLKEDFKQSDKARRMLKEQNLNLNEENEKLKKRENEALRRSEETRDEMAANKRENAIVMSALSTEQRVLKEDNRAMKNQSAKDGQAFKGAVMAISVLHKCLSKSTNQISKDMDLLRNTAEKNRRLEEAFRQLHRDRQTVCDSLTAALKKIDLLERDLKRTEIQVQKKKEHEEKKSTLSSWLKKRMHRSISKAFSRTSKQLAAART